MANSICLLLGVRLKNSMANMNSMDTSFSRIRDCRKLILCASMYFPNFLASLLRCMRTRLCSAGGVALLAPQLSRCLVIMAGSLGLPCAQKLYSWETHYPAPVTLQLLMASCGWSSLSHLDSLYQHSHYNMNSGYGTAQLKWRGDYTLPHYSKRSLASLPPQKSCVSCAASLAAPAPQTSFFPPLLYLGNVATLPKFPFFHKWCFCPLCWNSSHQGLQRVWMSLRTCAPYFWFQALACTRALCSFTSCHLPRFCLLPSHQHLSLFVAILLFLFHRGTASASAIPFPIFCSLHTMTSLHLIFTQAFVCHLHFFASDSTPASL